MPTITAFEASPDRGRGLARDMRVRWALEEVGQDYDVRLLSFAAMKQPQHLALHPFGQIPTYEGDGGLALFESGAILLHIAETYGAGTPWGILPAAPAARARAINWLFAAVNTVEPPILELSTAVLVERDQPWTEARLPQVRERVSVRLGELSRRLGEAEWLEPDGFTVGDLMMVTVLHRLEASGLMNDWPNIVAYVARGRSRPAYQRAFAAQLAVFEASQATA
jgi:glutathione S-transferase